MKIPEIIADLKKTIAGHRKQIAWLKKHAEAIESTGLKPSIYAYSLDFDNLKHPQIIALIKALGGKWTKTMNGDVGKVDYEAEIDGMRVRCWRGEPPAACKLVSFEEYVPATVRTSYRLECPKSAVTP